jgi:spore cortex formation protein SpoVR/YcgB (stage V sporulation)
MTKEDIKEMITPDIIEALAANVEALKDLFEERKKKDDDDRWKKDDDDRKKKDDDDRKKKDDDDRKKKDDDDRKKKDDDDRKKKDKKCCCPEFLKFKFVLCNAKIFNDNVECPPQGKGYRPY